MSQLDLFRTIMYVCIIMVVATSYQGLCMCVWWDYVMLCVYGGTMYVCMIHGGNNFASILCLL